MAVGVATSVARRTSTVGEGVATSVARRTSTMGEGAGVATPTTFESESWIAVFVDVALGKSRKCKKKKKATAKIPRIIFTITLAVFGITKFGNGRGKYANGGRSFSGVFINAVCFPFLFSVKGLSSVLTRQSDWHERFGLLWRSCSLSTRYSAQ